MTTGDPGSEAQVYNTGDERDAVFDFVIPRGADGGGGTLDVLATVDTSSQPSAAGRALTFADVPLISGSSITHTPGSTDIAITTPGIYEAAFQGSAEVEAGGSIPATAALRLYLNGAEVPGAFTSHTFASSIESASLSFHVPFQVTAVPATLQVVTEAPGFTLSNLSLTVTRLGDATGRALTL